MSATAELHSIRVGDDFVKVEVDDEGNIWVMCGPLYMRPDQWNEVVTFVSAALEVSRRVA